MLKNIKTTNIILIGLTVVVLVWMIDSYRSHNLFGIVKPKVATA